LQRAARGVDLHCADGIGAIQDLALQVGEVDLVAVGQRELADAGGGEVEGGGAAEAAGADDQRVGGSQLLLPLDPDFGKEDVTAVAEELLVVQFGLVCATVGDWLFTGSPLRKASACRS
jgi:hypothetical protein